MELKMNFNSFIKLKDFFDLIDVSAEVDEFNELDNLIEGKLNIKGKYLKRDNITTEYFSEYIPFSIVISNENYEVEDILCIDVEHVTVESRGFDVSFDILVKYNIFEEETRVDENNSLTLDEENIVDENNSLTLDEENIIDENNSLTLDEENVVDFEKIKENETKRIDELLYNTLNCKDDNLPTDEIIIRNLKDSISNIKICYYQNDKELDKICQSNNVGLNEILSNNKKYANAKYKRIMLSGNE